MNQDEQARRAEIARAERARALLNDPLLIEAFATLEQDYIDGWTRTGVDQSEGREAIWRHLQALRQVRAHLESAVQTGRMARHQLAQLTGRPLSEYD
jgi:hypothetical protein